jgi:hypothetical protein
MNTEYSVVRFHDEERWATALCRIGEKLAHMTIIGPNGVVHVTVPKEEQRKFQPVLYRNNQYPVERAVKMFRKFGRARSITAAAKAELDRASESA